MTKIVNITGSVDQVVIGATIAAVPGSAGSALLYAKASSKATISNTSPTAGFEYKINGGAWIFVGRDSGKEVDINFQADILYFRQVSSDTSNVSVEVSIDSTVSPTVNSPRFAMTASGNTSGILLETGAVATLGRPRKQSMGTVVSYNDGARGEAVLAETTPAGGSNSASVDPGGRFATPTRRVFCAADATNGTIRYNAPSGKTFGRMTTNDSILVLMYLAAVNSADTLTVTISSDNMTNGASATIGLNPNKSANTNTYNKNSGYWWQLIDASAFTGTTTLPANINSIRAKITRSGAVATDVHVLGVLKGVRNRPTIIIDFDDGFASQYTHAFQIAQQYGIVGNIGVIAQTVGKNAGDIDTFDYCTLKQLQDMRDGGWGMATHGYYPHNQAGTMNSYANILADVKANRDYVLNNLTNASAMHYILPAGQQHPSTDQVLSELGFFTCRGTIGQQTVEQPGGVDNPYRLFGTPISAGASPGVGLADMKAKFDTARKCGATIRYQGHRVVSSVTDTANEILDTDWDAFCAYIAPYIASGEVLNPTLGEWEAVRLR